MLAWVAAAGCAEGGESWHVSAGPDVLFFSDNQPARDGVAGTLRLGYDLDAPVSIELGGLAGSLDVRDHASTGGWSALYGSWADALFHFARWERLDPFCTLGAGEFWSGADGLPDHRQAGFAPRVGVGVLYTLSEHWSFRTGVTVMSLQLNRRHDYFGMVEAGLSYYFGDTTPAHPGQAD